MPADGKVWSGNYSRYILSIDYELNPVREPFTFPRRHNSINGSSKTENGKTDGTDRFELIPDWPLETAKYSDLSLIDKFFEFRYIAEKNPFKPYICDSLEIQ